MIETMAPSSRCTSRPASRSASGGTARASTPGARRHDQGVHRHLRSVRGADRRRIAHQHRGAKPEEAAQEIVLHLEREGFIGMNRNSCLTNRLLASTAACESCRKRRFWFQGARRTPGR